MIRQRTDRTLPIPPPSQVATLQRKIQNLEADKKALASDKSTLLESNRKMIGQLNSMFSFGQAVQTGLAFRGLDVNATK